MQQGSGSLRLRIPIPAAATPADAADAAAAIPRGAQSPSGFSISPSRSRVDRGRSLAFALRGAPQGGEHEARVVSKFAIYYSTVQLCSTVVCSFYKVS